MQKLRKTLFNSVINKVIILVLTLLPILLLFISFSMRTSFEEGGKSIWVSASFKSSSDNFFPIIALLFIMFFVIYVILAIISIISLFSKNKTLKRLCYAFFVYSICYNVCIFFASIASNIFYVSTNVMVFLNVIICIFAFIFKIIFKSTDEKVLNEKIVDAPADFKPFKYQSIVILIINTIGLIIVFSSYFLPFLTMDGTTYYLSKVFTSNPDISYNLNMLIFASVTIGIGIIGLFKYISTLSYFSGNKYKFCVKSRNLNYLQLFGMLAYFLMAFSYIFIMKLQKKADISTISFIPFIIIGILSVLLAFILGNLKKEYIVKEKKKKPKKYKYRFVPLLFAVAFSLVTITSIFFNFIEIKFSALSTYESKTSFSGFELLKNYQNLKAIFQILAFAFFIMIGTSIISLIFVVIGYASNSEDYNRFVKINVFMNFFYMFFIALSGIFFMINQKIMDSSIKNLLQHFGIYVEELYSYTIKSDAIYPFFISLILLIAMMLTNQLKPHQITKELSLENMFENTGEGSNNFGNINPALGDFNPCPAFYELDLLEDEFDTQLEFRRSQLFDNPTLPNLIDFIVTYARDSRLHLSYSKQDIATFIAGLGAARLSILQGMSGTGKTSLPKIFAEAIMGNCELVEVESSWRDKNELLGYYNEFSKVFTPKKFTQSLYKAKLNKDVITLIVLDEMNLSRIEYYFSDFLSLMEAEEDKREIKLLNVNLAITNGGQITEFKGLINGHTLKIPTNVWFIGTANRDESTFEISDKVYDRAQTMNFNRRAPKVKNYSTEKSPKFLSYNQLSDLLNTAKDNGNFDAEDNSIIQEIENLLIPFNISFGNRILKQIEEYVNIYCACFEGDVLNEAIENILLSKVVSKLEFKDIENKEKLAKSFDKLNLNKCSEFVRRLIEG